MEKNKVKTFIFLHILLAFYSLSGVLSKLASGQAFLSFPFFYCYGGVLFVLVLYALGWQQVLKRLPLTLAFSNKAVTLVWSMVFGVLVFGEQVRWTQLLGCALAVTGVVIFARSKETENDA